MKKSILGLALLFGLGLSSAQAQEATTTSGGDALGAGGSVTYSVGQVVYTTATGTNGSVAQGVQQPYEISVVTGLKEVGVNLTLSVYPNPAVDYLTLRVDDYTHEDISYQLIDLRGNILETKRIIALETGIVMTHVPSATYLLRVIKNNQEVKTFKIIKGL